MQMKFGKEATGNGLLNVRQYSDCPDSDTTGHTIETPCAFLYTSCGTVPHLTNESMRKLQNIPRVGILSLSTLSEYADVVAEVEGGAPAFTRLDCICPVTLCVGNDVLHDLPQKSSKKAVIIKNRGGNMHLSSQEYNKMQSVFKCDIQQSELVAKAFTNDDDGVGGTKSKEASFKKNRTFLEEFLKEAQGDSKSVMVSVPYNCSKTIKWILDDNLSLISGISLATSRSMEWNKENLQILAQSMEIIPSDIPVMVTGPLDPLVICHLSNVGVSLFDTSYTVTVTGRGGALCFPLDTTAKLTQPDRLYEIDLEQDTYSDQFKPIVSSCTCTTCSKFTQAYLNHLLKTKEMLAKVLLMIHNLHHYMLFMDAVRQFMKDGKLNCYIKTLDGFSATTTHAS